MEPLIQRRTELHICNYLRTNVPGLTIVPFSGGDETGDAFDIEPPFAVVGVTEAEKTHQQENTWICRGTLQWVTHSTETTPQDHDTSFREVVAYLTRIPASQEGYFSFHGIDIGDEKRATDDSASARASIIAFTCGVSG